MKSSLPGIDLQNVFVLELDSEKIVTDGEDKTATNMTDSTKWSRLWLVQKTDDTITAVVIDMDSFYIEDYTKIG